MRHLRAGPNLLRVLWNVSLATRSPPVRGGTRSPAWYSPLLPPRELKIGGGTLQVDFAAGPLTFRRTPLSLRMCRPAASAITTYYGRFPVERARILIVPVPDRSGIVQGTDVGLTWPGSRHDAISLGQHATQEDLNDDWMMTHELDHMAFPSCPTISIGWKRAWQPMLSRLRA